MQNRSRTCINTPPAFGGESCPGESDETRACNEDPCPSNFGSHNRLINVIGRLLLFASCWYCLMYCRCCS